MPEINDMLLMMKNTIDNRLKSKSKASSVTEGTSSEIVFRRTYMKQ
jgi:hypothetical protein